MSHAAALARRRGPGVLTQATPPTSPVTGDTWSDTSKPAPVVLTFDDNRADQLAVLPVLAAVGAKATFYCNSGRFYGHSTYTNTYMSIGDAQRVASLGHEIGGHTLIHDTLLGVDPTLAAAQLAQDRQALIAWGLGAVKSFAYPYTQVANEAAVTAAGYTNARNGPVSGAGSISSYAPSDVYAWTGLGASTSTSTTLAEMQGYVTAAAATATGTPVVFLTHEVGAAGLDLTVLTNFVNWCYQRGTAMLTATEVFG